MRLRSVLPVLAAVLLLPLSACFPGDSEGDSEALPAWGDGCAETRSLEVLPEFFGSMDGASGGQSSLDSWLELDCSVDFTTGGAVTANVDTVVYMYGDVSVASAEYSELLAAAATARGFDAGRAMVLPGVWEQGYFWSGSDGVRQEFEACGREGQWAVCVDSGYELAAGYGFTAEEFTSSFLAEEYLPGTKAEIEAALAERDQ
jgi:hypothetical protein